METSNEARENGGDPRDESEHHQLTITSLSGEPLLGKRPDRLGEIEIHKLKDKRSEKNRIEELKRRFSPPDGGYGKTVIVDCMEWILFLNLAGWFVAFGAFLVQFWIAGLIKSYGVIFLEVMQMFPGASASLASWIPAVLSALSLILAPLSSGLCQKFSCRAVVFLGGLFCWLGISLSFFATTLPQLCLTFGVLTGIGAGLSTTPGIIMTSRYFNKHRSLANGICVSGTAAGSMVLPSLLQILVPYYGFRGTMLIFGACMLHICLSAMLYRPIEVHQAIVELHAEKKSNETHCKTLPEEADMNNCSSPIPDRFLAPIPENGVSGNEYSGDTRRRSSFLKLPKASHMAHSMEDLSTDSTIYLKERKQSLAAKSNEQSSKEKSATSWTTSIGRYIDFTLLRNPLFILLTSTVMLMAVGCPHALFYVPSHAYSLGISRSDCSLLLSISAAFDFVGRIGIGYVADLHLFSSSRAYSLSVLTSGVAVLCIPWATSFASFAVIVSFYGFGLGTWFLLIPTLLSEYFGTESIGSSYGFVRLFQSSITLSIPPLIGFTKDATGDYLTGFYIMGIAMVFGAIIINFESYIKRRTTRDREQGLEDVTKT